PAGTIAAAGTVLSAGTAASASIPANGEGELVAAVAVPADLAGSGGAGGSSLLRAALTLPSEPGTTAQLVRVFPIQARTPAEPIVEIFSEPLVRGTSPKVRVKVNNRGSAAMELKSAPSSDVLVQLLTLEGTALSSARLSQTGNGALTGPSGYFVAIGAGSGVMLDPVELAVPQGLGASARIAVNIAKAYSGLATDSPVSALRAFSSTQTYSGVASPPYTATVSAEQPLYDQGASVVLLGTAVDTGGNLVPGATVQLGVSVRGFERRASSMTDDTGHYSILFSPSPNESGLYTLWAAHPDVTDRSPQSSFTIAGFAFQYGDFTANLTQNAAMQFRVELRNTGQNTLTGFTGDISGPAAPGVTLALDPTSVPAQLGAGQGASLLFTAHASPTAQLGNASFLARVVDSNGFSRSMPVTVRVAASAPAPVAEPQAFTVGMSAGATRTIAVTLKNNGTQSWTGVKVTQPTLAWVSVQGAAQAAGTCGSGGSVSVGEFCAGDIPAGGSTNINLVLAPQAGLTSQAYAANPLVEVHSQNAGTIPINAAVTITASGKGGAVYSILDADKPRDAYGAGSPAPGAKASLTSLEIAGLNRNANADANGVARFVDVPAGRYSLSITAPGYETKNAVETIEPGVDRTAEVLLPTDVVSYDWSVTPTTIVDRYELKLTMSFKTDVPAPVVVVEPGALNFNLPDGGSADGQLTVTNRGLVSAFDVKLFPKINDTAVSVDIPYGTIAELHAGQSVVVPFRLSLAHASCHAFSLNTSYNYPCAAGGNTQKTLPPINGTAGDCFGLPTGGVGGGGTNSSPSWGGGGGSGGASVSLSVPSSYISMAVANPPAQAATPKTCQLPTRKTPSSCIICDFVTWFTDAGGDPRVPESDLSVSVPKYRGSLDFTRVYDSHDQATTTLGKAWMHAFESRINLRRATNVFIPQGGEVTANYGGGDCDVPLPGGGCAMTLVNNRDFMVTPEDLVELRSPGGQRLIYRYAGGTAFSAPVGETGVLTVDGSTMNPGGYAWTQDDKTVYHYDGTGKLLDITDPNGNAASMVYNGGNLASVKDPDNRTIYTFSYDGNGRLSNVTDLAGRTVDFEYEPSDGIVHDHMLKKVTGPKGVTSYGYTDYQIENLDNFAYGALSGLGKQRMLTSVTSPNGNVTSFGYGPAAHVIDYGEDNVGVSFASFMGGSPAATYLVSKEQWSGKKYKSGDFKMTGNKVYYAPLIPGTSGYVLDGGAFADWYFPQKLLTLSESGPLGTWSFEHTIDE
ncbi:MAG: carboxypeptidase regulatory-like domain-containing protein, partial [Elusimicrobiota bacterium]